MKKVLVVDDAKVVRVSLGKIMQSLGFDVFDAEDGQKAVEMMEQHPDIELVMLDWNMPNMNGYEFLVQLRAQPDHASSPAVIMVTTETGMNSMLKALAAGADEYIMKPFDREMVASKLDIIDMAHSA